MTVTQIEPFNKGKGRVSIYLNNEFSFVLYKGELSQYGIEIGSIVDEELYSRILNEVLILRAKKRGMNLLMTMDRTVNDVRNKLFDGGYPIEAVDAAIEYLESFHYLDDYRYASNYIQAKSSSMSVKAITMKLVGKGISADVIENALADYKEDNNDSESELIKKLINKRIKGNLANISYEEKQKLYAFLYNKGFSIASIEKSYRELYEEAINS